MSGLQHEKIFHRVEKPGTRIDNEMIFFDQDAGSYYATGPVGASIWEYLETPKSGGAICNHLLETFDVDRPTCERQVQAFLSQMIDAGLVAVRET